MKYSYEGILLMNFVILFVFYVTSNVRSTSNCHDVAEYAGFNKHHTPRLARGAQQ